MSVLKIVVNIGYFLLAINILIYFKRFLTKKKVFKIFSFYLLTMCIVQLTAHAYNVLNKNNLFLSHYYFIGQFLFLSFFYSKLINQITLIKVLTSIVFLCLIVQYSIYPEKYFTFNLFEIILCSITLIIYSFLFFIKNIDGKKTHFLYINSGVFIYILSSTLIFSSGNLMSRFSKSVNTFIWTINGLLYIFYQILIFVEWYKNFRKPIS